MDNDIAIEMRNKAGENYRIGYNCSEAIIVAFRELVAPDLDSKVIRMFTGFGGGIGHAGCMCGALTASVAVLGLLKGRVNADGDRDSCYKLVHEFHDRFEQKFSSTCCRVLNPYPFETKEHLKNCLKITGNTAKLLTEFLIEKELLSPGK